MMAQQQFSNIPTTLETSRSYEQWLSGPSEAFLRYRYLAPSDLHAEIRSASLWPEKMVANESDSSDESSDDDENKPRTSLLTDLDLEFDTKYLSVPATIQSAATSTSRVGVTTSSAATHDSSKIGLALNQQLAVENAALKKRIAELELEKESAKRQKPVQG